jgi:hypothetical protein
MIAKCFGALVPKSHGPSPEAGRRELAGKQVEQLDLRGT